MVVGVLANIGPLDIGQERAEPVELAVGGHGQHLVVVGDLGQPHAIDFEIVRGPVFGIAALNVFLRREARDLGQRP